MADWEKYWGKYRVTEAKKFYVLRREGEIKKALSLLRKPSPRILEAGCGFGFNVRRLTRENSCFALDISKKAIGVVKKEVPSSLVGDIQRMPFKDGSFDLVFNAGVIEHFESSETALKEMVRVLDKGGLLLVLVPGRFNLWHLYKKLKGRNWHAGFEKSYSLKDLKKEVSSAGAEIVFSGGFDSLTLKGSFLRAFRIKLPVNTDWGFAHQEVFVCAKKD